jgi:hypothetical protein
VVVLLDQYVVLPGVALGKPDQLRKLVVLYLDRMVSHAIILTQKRYMRRDLQKKYNQAGKIR